MAPERFLERCNFIEVTHRPENLLSDSLYDSLSEDMWEKFVSNQQTKDTYIKKMILWKYLFISIKVSKNPDNGFFFNSTLISKAQKITIKKKLE